MAKSDETPVIVGAGTMRTGRLDEVEARERRDEQRSKLLALGAAGYRTFLAGDLDEQHTPFLLAPDGSVWVRPSGIPAHGWDARRHGLVVYPDSSFEYVIPSRDWSPDAPADAAALEAKAERRAVAQREAEAKAERQREALLATARAITLGDYQQHGPKSLREAAERIEKLGGTIRVENTCVVVLLPPSQLGWPALGTTPPPWIGLADYVYRSERIIIEVMKGKDGRVAAAKLPARAVLPNGASL